MTRTRITLLIAAIGLALGGLVPAAPAHAQSSGCYTIIINATETEYLPVIAYAGRTYTISASGTIQFTPYPSEWVDALYYYNGVEVFGPGTMAPLNAGALVGSYPAVNTITHTYNYAVEGNNDYIGFRHTSAYYGGAVTFEVCGNFNPPGTVEGVIRPLTENNESAEWPYFDGATLNRLAPELGTVGLSVTDPNTMVVPANRVDALVYAVQDGTVVDYRRFVSDECQSLLGAGLPTLALCTVLFSDSLDAAALLALNLDALNAYIVTVESADITWEYLVTDAPGYIGGTGLEITQGCILGKTVSLDSVATNLSLIPIPESITLITGYVTGDTESTPILSAFDAAPYPTPGQACNVNSSLADCKVNNPDLQNGGADWDTTGDVIFTPAGTALMQQNNSIFQAGIYDPATSYAITVQARARNSGGMMGVSFGNSPTERFQLSQEWQNYTIPAQTYNTTIAGGVYDLWITNNSVLPAQIEIGFACITEGEPTTAPGDCYFQNHAFDFGDTAWTVSAPRLTVNSGYISVPDGETFGQDAHLYPASGGPATHTLRIEASLYSDPSATLTTPFTAPTIEYQWDGGWINVPILQRPSPGRYIFRTTFTVENETDEFFNFRVGTDTANGVSGLKISLACIEGPFPQQEGIPPPPRGGNCDEATFPTRDDTSYWIAWLWDNMDRFFQCDLMPTLDDMYTLMNRSYNLFAQTQRYWIVANLRTNTWLNTSLIPWLGGHFHNMAVGQVTVVNTEGPCNNLFCLLDGALGDLFGLANQIISLLTAFLGQAASIVLNLLTVIVNLAIVMLANALSMLAFARGIFITLINTYNTAPPAVITGIPNCAVNPRGNPFCAGIWVLDNTIFSGWGAIVIPMLIGLGSVHLVIWAMYTIRKAVGEVRA